MNDKLVSIIIPTYNRCSFIKEAINSVLNQTYQNFEILVIDDGSTDNTKEIINSFNDRRINYIYQEHSGFPAAVRNAGLKIAKGEYIAFLDSDDIWLPQKLEKQIKVMEKNPEKLLVSTNGIIFPAFPKIKILSFNKDKELSFKELLKKNIIINSSVLMRKEIINKIGFLDENFNLKSGQDHDYWLRILNYKEESILVLKDTLVKYRDHTNSRITLFKQSDFFFRKYKKRAYIYKKYTDFNQNYLNQLLKSVIYEYHVSKLKEALFSKHIDLYKFLRIKSIKISDKLLISLEYIIKFTFFPIVLINYEFLNKLIRYFKNIAYRFFKKTNF